MNRPESVFGSGINVLGLMDLQALIALRRFNFGGAAYEANNGVDALTDIGFSGKFPDTSALETYADGNLTKLSTLYDRLGLYELNQTSASLQPKLTDGSGIELTESGEPYLLFDGGPYISTGIDELTFNNSFSYFAVFIPTDVTVTNEIVISQGADNSGVTGVTFFYRNSNSFFFTNGNGIKGGVTGSPLVTGTPYIIECHGDLLSGVTYQADAYINGVHQGSSTYAGNIENTNRPFRIGARSSDSVLPAKMKFFGIYPCASCQLANREVIYNYLLDLYSDIF